MSLDPQRTIAELRELQSLTGDAAGAQRVAFTPTWVRARAWLAGKLAAIPGVETHRDAAGNLWSTLPGAKPEALLLGGHIDSVPNGGWLDGCLGSLASIEVLRRLAESGPPPVTVRCVDWADEEGARFGRSLFGSSAFSGRLDRAEARTLVDRAGVTLPAALAEVGLDFDRLHECGSERARAAAYLELHIEQGPVLLELDRPLGVVLGTFGVERQAITFRGQAAHAGSTPMHLRRDAFRAAGRMAEEIYAIAGRSGGGVCTIGACTTRPGIPTSVVEECRLVLDQRHLDPAALARMWGEAQAAARQFAEAGGVTVSFERIQQVPPRPFHPELVERAAAVVAAISGDAPRLPSGPLHDAAEVAAAGIPTAMLFVQSLHGISHHRSEDTRAEHLALAVRAFDRLADETIAWIRRRG